MQYKIAVIPGDGIGPEVTGEAVKALDAVGRRFGHQFDYEYVLAGGAAIDQAGECLPQKTIDVAKSSDAVLLGAVGGPKWDTLPGDERPEKALLRLRKELGEREARREAQKTTSQMGKVPKRGGGRKHRRG